MTMPSSDAVGASAGGATGGPEAPVAAADGGSTAAGVTPAGGSASADSRTTNAARDPDLVLARVHLRLGSLSLARTELETLAGRVALDDAAVRDLAEARWRTGDIVGAGEAATAWLEGHPDDVLGLVIAAEAQAALGRPGEARRLAGLAAERADGSLDPLFAGMQRSPIWPVEPGSAVGPVGVLFDDLHPGPYPVAPLPPSTRSEVPRGIGLSDDEAARAGELAASAASEPAASAAQSAGPSLWGEDAAGAGAPAEAALEPTVLFHDARIALDEGRVAEAATGLILALRASPRLAPAILDLLGGRGEPILALVRGDAQRVVGREVEAMRDHATAAGGVSNARESSESAAAVTADTEHPNPSHPVQEDP